MAKIYKFPNREKELSENTLHKPSFLENKFLLGSIFLMAIFSIFTLLEQFNFRGGSFLFLLFMSLNIVGALTVSSFFIIAKWQEFSK